MKRYGSPLGFVRRQAALKTDFTSKEIPTVIIIVTRELSISNEDIGASDLLEATIRGTFN